MLEESHKKRQQVSDTMAEEREKLRGLIEQHNLTDAGEDGEQIKPQLETVRGQMMSLQEQRGRLEAEHAEAERRWQEKEQEEEKLHAAQSEARLASDLRKLLGSEFTDFLSRGAIEALMRDASAHLQRLTHGRYTFDIAHKGRAITLQIVDHEDQGRARPTHSLSGGETFLASLAIALALSQGFRTVATGRAAQTSTECLILDEGFGTLESGRGADGHGNPARVAGRKRPDGGYYYPCRRSRSGHADAYRSAQRWQDERDYGIRLRHSLSGRDR